MAYEIVNLTKSYGNLTVYENFSLSLKENTITCVLGESGSGKTTLLNCLARLTDCSGTLPNVKCSFVFQSPRLVPNLTVLQNLKLICADEQKILKMLDRINLAEKAQAYPKSLSGGQAQRVALARALLYNAPLMLLDEPFSSLDLKLKLSMQQLLKEVLKEYSQTALFVTHNADEACALADRVVVIKDGKIFYDKITEGVGEDDLRRELISALTL